jgi:hypothetical protein
MNSIGRMCAGAAAALLLAPWAGIAQENKGPVPDAPGPVHKQMERLAGNWDVDIVYIFNGKENKGKAKCETRWILDGRFLQQEYKSLFMGRPYTVLQHLGYDNQKKKTIEITMNSLSTGVHYNEGSISEDGKVITNEGDALDPKTGKSTKLRTVTTIVDDDHYTLEWFKPGADGRSEKVVSMSHMRRKPG